MDLCITVTPKVHAVFEHISEFLEQTADEFAVNSEPSAGDSVADVYPGLGFWSEQASEAAHSDFAKIWQQGHQAATSPQTTLSGF